MHTSFSAACWLGRRNHINTNIRSFPLAFITALPVILIETKQNYNLKTIRTRLDKHHPPFTTIHYHPLQCDQVTWCRGKQGRIKTIGLVMIWSCARGRTCLAWEFTCGRQTLKWKIKQSDGAGELESWGRTNDDNGDNILEQ